MAQDIKLIVYPAKDLESAKAVFSSFLGAEPYADAPYYVGYKTASQEVGLDPNGQAIVSYIDVTDVKNSLQALLDAGAVIQQEIKEVAPGMVIAQVKDLNNNVLGLRGPS
ncbi:MAG: hypothetical protein JWM85_683 [Acidimicrobiaceae bacterium]|nr:hypothetical protein [Acidimicrobiaceae bacterium]